MRSRRFRLGLLLAVLAGLASCEINPQPPLPARGMDVPVTPGAGGSLALGEGTSGAQSGPVVAGGTGSDNANGGSLASEGGGGDAQGEGGAGGASAPTPDDGGAGGATDAGGAGGASGAIAEPGPK